MSRALSIDGVQVPRFLYGTAWKKDKTKRLTELAISQGFRGIDTANQRKHYHAAAVGEGITQAVKNGVVAWDDLFVQTKFTFPGGQDHRLPYEPGAPVAAQVEQSFASSLEHLGTDVIDCYVLHGPTRRDGLEAADWQAWRAMEGIRDCRRARLLGVSNVSLEQLRILCEGARIRPSIVQNRFYAARGWDRQIRAFCSANEIVYQGFSLLTANRKVAAHRQLVGIAKRHQRSASQIIFRFALDVGMVPLTGTTDAEHMWADLDVFDFRLEPGEIETIEALGVP